jgi:hypothetical protein
MNITIARSARGDLCAAAASDVPATINRGTVVGARPRGDFGRYFLTTFVDHATSEDVFVCASHQAFSAEIGSANESWILGTRFRQARDAPVRNAKVTGC